MTPADLAEIYQEALRLTETQGLAIGREDWDTLEQLLAERQVLLDRAALHVDGFSPDDPALEPARAALQHLLAREAENQAILEDLQARLEQRRQTMSQGAGALARYRVSAHADEGSWYIDDSR